LGSEVDGREAVVQQVEAELGVRPPDALLDIWTGVTPVNGLADVAVYGPHEIAERNSTYEVQIYRPDLLLIGDDGCGRGLFIVRSEPDPMVIRIGHGAIGSDDGERVGRLSALASDGFRSLPNDHSGGPDSPPTGPIDILLTGRPAAGIKALFDVRRLLGLSMSMSQLTAADAAFPQVLLTNVRYSKYATAISELNERYGCLSTRSHRGEQ
jgi:hypothetical protein